MNKNVLDLYKALDNVFPKAKKTGHVDGSYYLKDTNGKVIGWVNKNKFLLREAYEHSKGAYARLLEFNVDVVVIDEETFLVKYDEFRDQLKSLEWLTKEQNEQIITILKQSNQT